MPQDGLLFAFCFLFGLFLCVCWDVGYELFSTRPTWFHVGAVTVWMWRHVSFAFFLTPKNSQQLVHLRMGKRIHLCEYETNELAKDLAGVFDKQVCIPRVMHGNKQTIDTLLVRKQGC